MRLRTAFLAAASLVAFGSGCSSAFGPGDGVFCTAEVAPGIEVEVVDAATGAYVARGARGTVRDGTYGDTLSPARSRGLPPNDTLESLQGAHERPGTYTLAVERAGYQLWQRTGIRVTRAACHVGTVQLTARLDPLP
jgi:hypothetical protein